MQKSEEELRKRKELKRKIEICNMLGANKFKSVVLAIEKLKYKVIKNVFPFIPKKYEKMLAKSRDKALSKAKTEEEKQQITRNYREQILEWRKEIKTEKNRNYHMDEQNPTKMLGYIKWNKQVHEKSLIKDLIILTASSVGIAALGATPLLTSLAIISTLAGFIDFQCINIQNSHIYRYQLIEEKLKRRESTKAKWLLDKYSKVGNVYAKVASETKEVPTIIDLINAAESKEELEQIRNMILSVQKAKKDNQTTKTSLDHQPFKQTKTEATEKPETIEQKSPQAPIKTNLPGQTSLQKYNSNLERQADLIIDRMVKDGEQASTGTNKNTSK